MAFCSPLRMLAGLNRVACTAADGDLALAGVVQPKADLQSDLEMGDGAIRDLAANL